ncbi:MBOAT family protein [Stecheria sp. CLA-KB-P133]|uniref:MBOAT family protein n=1 Tax=Grylomicrobium aquisgranensis TaxID=2926318 RepID=A0AB35U707_9FIRM|nr:MBOAT family protein [Stecheria sp. CLA-KB-P133]
MAYTDLIYLLLFLPCCILIYQLVPVRFRKYVLLLFSWMYFILCSKKLIICLLATTLFVYLMGLVIDKAPKKSRTRKALFILGLFGLFGTLLYVKYTNFFIRIINDLGHHSLSALTIAAPIGISFYTLEAVSYLTEVYWGREKADHDFCSVALFLSFFPQIMEGPIARYQDTAAQLTKGEGVHLAALQAGCVRILWGLFKKMVIADRLNTAVNVLFTNYTSYTGAMTAVSGIFYAVQLYMEFSGAMDIVIGSAQMFGITLPENFRQPFFSQSAAEFWRRWHITLGVWCKTYLFYPVTTSKLCMKWNKYGKKKFGKYITKIGICAMSLTPVWLFNGIWHGPQMNYIFYGIYYLVILMIGEMLEPVKKAFYKKTGFNKNNVFCHTFRIVRTWVILFTGEMFFRANGLRAGLAMFKRIFENFHLSALWNDGGLMSLNLDHHDYLVIGIGILVVLIYDILKENNIDVYDAVSRQKAPVRWACVYLLLFAVIIFAAYGTGYDKVGLIYAGF